MDLFALIWQASGGVLGILLGRQLTVVILKQRRRSIDSGLHWPWEWADSAFFRTWGLGLFFALAFAIIIFGFQAAVLGFAAGVPIGFVLRKTWKINEGMPNLIHEEGYTGD